MYTLITDLTATELQYLKDAILDSFDKERNAGHKKEAKKIATLYIKIYKNAEKKEVIK